MAKGKIMVVDDEADVRDVIRLHLEKAGFNVLEASDGRQAIDALHEGDHFVNLGAILCDIRMPNINGVEAIEVFKKEAPGIPVIVVTGYPDTELAVSLMKKREGIKLDGTYTGKALAALQHDAKSGSLQGKAVLFWNTLNSRDFPDAIADADYHDLPRPFHRYFEEEVQPLDRDY